MLCPLAETAERPAMKLTDGLEIRKGDWVLVWWNQKSLNQRSVKLPEVKELLGEALTIIQRMLNEES